MTRDQLVERLVVEALRPVPTAPTCAELALGRLLSLIEIGAAERPALADHHLAVTKSSPTFVVAPTVSDSSLPSIT